MPALTRGPLPSSVYWRRRLVVLTVALLFLWLVVHLLGGSGGTPKASPAASLTGASASPDAGPSGGPTAGASTGASAGASAVPSSAAPTPTPTPTVLPSPSGACAPSDLAITPSVTSATAGSDVAITLTLRTFATPACTWHVSHKTMQVKVTTAGGRDVWSTLECPAAVPTTDVVVYQDAAPSPVTLTWSSRFSDADCSTHTAWAKQGGYTVTAVALGGAPAQTTFTLAAPLAAPPPAPSTSAAPAPTAAASVAASMPTAPTSPSTTATTKHHKKRQIAD